MLNQLDTDIETGGLLLLGTYRILKICFVPNKPSGAVIRGQKGNQVESRIARRSYGFNVKVTFDPKKHRADETLHWCSYEEEWKLHDRMTWYILKVST